MELLDFKSFNEFDLFGSRSLFGIKKNKFSMRSVNLEHISPLLYSKNLKVSSHTRACQGVYKKESVSLDLLRGLLQPSLNQEINSIIQKYIQVYFFPAKKNLIANSNGCQDNDSIDKLISMVACQILEEAKKMFIEKDTLEENNYQNNSETFVDNKKNVNNNSSDNINNKNYNEDSEDLSTRNTKTKHSIYPFLPKKRKRTFSSGSDSNLTFLQKKKHANQANKPSSGRSTPNKNKLIKVLPRREGPKWELERLTTETKFIMGSKANKALGLGATRGRLYMKHPDLFKYGGDADDKQWLYEKGLMPATGGRTYLLLLEDVVQLTSIEEYKNSVGLMMNELVGFSVPQFMINKMRNLMSSQKSSNSSSCPAPSISSHPPLSPSIHHLPPPQVPPLSSSPPPLPSSPYSLFISSSSSSLTSSPLLPPTSLSSSFSIYDKIKKTFNLNN